MRSDPFADPATSTPSNGAPRRAEVLDDLDELRPRQLPAVAPPAAGGGEYGALFGSVVPADRDREAMLRAAVWVGSRMGEDAVYSWEVRTKTGPKVVEGPTIGLAYALVGEWGGVATRSLIVERSPTRAKFRGEFIDLLRRTIVVREYVFSLAPPPGAFARDPVQRQRWETMQEQSAASKAVRGAILAGLPGWLVEAAVNAAKEAVRGSALTFEVSTPDGVETRTADLATCLSRAVTAFERWGVTEPELEALVGQPRGLWAISTLLQLRRVAASVRAGEMTADVALREAREQLAAERRGSVAAPTGGAEETAIRLGMAPAAGPATEEAAPQAADPAPTTEQPPEDTERAAAYRELHGLWESARPACEATGMTTLRGWATAGLDTLLDKVEAVRERLPVQSEGAR